MNNNRLTILWLGVIALVSFLFQSLVPSVLDCVTFPRLTSDILSANPLDVTLKGSVVRLVYYSLIAGLLVGVGLWFAKKMSPPQYRKHIPRFWHLTPIFVGLCVIFSMQNYDVEIVGKTLSGHLQRPISGRTTVSLSDVNLSKSGLSRFEGLRIVLSDGRQIVLPNERFHSKDHERFLAMLKARVGELTSAVNNRPYLGADRTTVSGQKSTQENTTKKVGFKSWLFGVFPLPLLLGAFILAAKLNKYLAGTISLLVGVALSGTFAVVMSIGVALNIWATGVTGGMAFWIFWFFGVLLSCVVTTMFGKEVLEAIKKERILESGVPPNVAQRSSAPGSENGLKFFVVGLLKNKPDIVRLGIKNGVDVNMLLGEGGETTPLIFSAHKGNLAICTALLEAGADPNQRNKRGHLALCEVLANTALSMDIRLQISKILLDQGADPNALDWGRPPLQFALESEQLIALLLAHRADVNKGSEYHELAGPRQRENYQYHENAIRYACKIGAMPEVTNALLAAGADPLLPNSEGDTAWDFVSNFLHKAPSEPIPSGREGAEKRVDIQARTALYEETVKLLKPVVMAARFDLFVSSDKSSGWGEFYRGRLEETGKRIWSSELLKRRLPYYEEIMQTHISNAPVAVIFLSAAHFSTEQGSSERRRELDALVKRFSSMPEKLLIVTTNELGKNLLTNHQELKPFPSFHLETGKVNELWANLADLCALPGDQAKDAFQDLRQIGSPSYDCFVSYRTVSVHTVRFLAEQLVARGAKPWFAEWKIMVSGRRDFQEAINQGIASSRNVICCTNSGYAQSEYCQIEAMQVLDMPGKQSRHILDLRLPDEPNAVSDALQKHGSEAVCHHEQTLQNTWESCCRFLGIQCDSLPERTIDGELNRFEVAGRPFLIALDSKWEIRRVDKQIRGGNTVIAFFSRKVGSVTLEGELVVGPWAIGLPGQTDSNDRDMFEAIITTIREWNRHGKILYPRGVHVVHVPSLHTASQLVAHPAFTHDDFATFCRHAYLMDDLVRGLSFGKTSKTSVASPI